jgi:hypothetical protein
MRINEMTAIKPIQPLTPSAARINALKQTKDRAADALSAERDRQKQAKGSERVQKAQQALAKARIIKCRVKRHYLASAFVFFTKASADRSHTLYWRMAAFLAASS